MQNAEQIVHEAPEQSESVDRLFGICWAIGQDLGFDPFYLRVALIGVMVFNPLATIGAYFALGAVVLLSHLLFPKAGAASSEPDQDESDERQELPLAA